MSRGSKLFGTLGTKFVQDYDQTCKRLIVIVIACLILISYTRE